MIPVTIDHAALVAARKALSQLEDVSANTNKGMAARANSRAAYLTLFTKEEQAAVIKAARERHDVRTDDFAQAVRLCGRQLIQVTLGELA